MNVKAMELMNSGIVIRVFRTPHTCKLARKRKANGAAERKNNKAHLFEQT
jgi:hypothetical protein